MADIASPVPTTPYIESVLSDMEKLSHWERRLLFKRRSRDQFPRFFYKFFPLNPEDAKSVRNLRDVVVESRFWLADHERFNDPFDLKANVVFEGAPADKERRLRQLIANQNPYAPRKERREILARMMKRPEGEWNTALQDIFRNRTKEVGVCSFAS